MKKGYKAFKLKDGKLWCIEVQYVIGETYEQTGEIELCENGLHYCRHLLDIADYYDYNSSIVICEVEDLGDISIDDYDGYGNKTVTNKLRIIKEIDKDEYPFKCDKNGNVIYYKNYDSSEYYYEYRYDKNGNVTYHKDCQDGDEEYYKYNENGDMIYQRYCDGHEIFYKYEYDERGNKIYTEDSYGYKEYRRYDDNNKVIYYKDYRANSHHYEYEVERDQKGNITYYKDKKGNERFCEYRYDQKGNMIYRKDPYKEEYWKYDDNNNMIYYKNHNGDEFKMIKEEATMKIRVKENVGKKSAEMFGKVGAILDVVKNRVVSDKMWLNCPVYSAQDLNNYISDNMHPDFYTIFEDISTLVFSFEGKDVSLAASLESIYFDKSHIADSVYSIKNSKFLPYPPSLEFEISLTNDPEIVYYEIKENVGKKSSIFFGKEGATICVIDGIVQSHKIWIGSKINSVEDLNNYIYKKMHPDFYTVFEEDDWCGW